ncbi:hypothetical protein [Listeria booriae]|uniref:hypothetical protein n=1 Tax=Listeria booriae TaxID=1552123 RepID=UPI001C8C6DC3|nr:hypothetical protein [Listeria booriae]
MLEQNVFKVPEQVKVTGVIYKVIESAFVESDNDKNCLGSCDYTTSTIELLETLSDSKKEQIFVHELTHAIFHEAGFECADEDMVNRIAIVLHQVLKDNWKADITEEVIMTYGGEEIARNVHVTSSQL